MSLIHWWPLDGTQPDYPDYGLYPMNGSVVGAMSYFNGNRTAPNGYSAGCPSTSVNSAGVNIPNGHQQLVNEIVNAGNVCSLSCWVYLSGNHPNYEGAIISSGNWNSRCWACGFNQDNTKFDPFGNGYNNLQIEYSFPIKEWFHIVSINNNGAGSVYVNGNLIGTSTKGQISTSSESNIMIGRETYASGHFKLNGYLSDLRLYDHVLSVSEIKNLYLGLYAHYDFSFDVDGTQIVDTSGYGRNTTTTINLSQNIITDDTPYSWSNALSLTTSGYIDISMKEDGRMLRWTYYPLSIAFWAKFDTNTTNATILENDDPDKYIYIKNGVTNVDKFKNNAGDNIFIDGLKQDLPTFAIPLDATWHHYIISGIPQIDSMNSLYLGDCEGDAFGGLIADLRIFGRPTITEAEARALYQRAAIINKNGTLKTNIKEDSTSAKPTILKNKLGIAKNFSENLTTKTLDDGSIWGMIYNYNYNNSAVAWTGGKDEARYCNVAGKYSILGDLDNLTPEDGWYEFLYYEENFGFYRWKQSYNPLSRYTSLAGGTSSEYTYIDGTTKLSNFYGLTRYTENDGSLCYLRGINVWWCAIAPYGTSFNLFPGFRLTDDTKSATQSLWIRLDKSYSGDSFFPNAKKYRLDDSKVKINKDSYIASEFIED